MDRTNQHQQAGQQQQAPAVVILQQPVIVGSGTLSPRGIPFLRRGIKLNNGTKIGPNSIMCLGVTGGILTMIGIPLLAGISVFTGILLLLLGGGLLAVFVKFCQKAKQDYDALPQDHPDRIKYSGIVYASRQEDGTVMPLVSTTPYQFVQGAQVITTTPATLQDGRVIVNSQLPSGFQIIGPSSSCQNESASHGNIRLSQYQVPMSTSPQCTVSIEDDKPPSYEEVCRNGANN